MPELTLAHPGAPRLAYAVPMFAGLDGDAVAALIHRVRQRWACQRGAELIEFAFVPAAPAADRRRHHRLRLPLPAICQVVTNAAREGARVAILPDFAVADVQQRVVAYLSASGLTATELPTVSYSNVP